MKYVNSTELSAVEMDARATLQLTKSLADFTDRYAELLPERVREAVAALHAESLRASHLVVTFVAHERNRQREAQRHG